MTGCNTGRNIQKYKGSGGTASTLQEALENSNIATIDINLISGAKFRGDGSALTGISGSGGAVGNLQQVTNQDNQTTNSIIITNTGTSLTTSGSINASGNITAPSFIGSGTSLTGIALAVNTSSNAARVSVLETDLTSNVSRVSGLETDLASNSTRIATVSTDLSSNASRVGVLETGLVSNSTRIGTVSTDLASNSTRIATVSTDLASNSTRIATVSTDLASNSTRITTVSTDLASNSTRIATVSTDLASNSTRIATVSTDLASNSTRIATISTDLASNSTRINNLQNSAIISNSSGITDAFETGDLIYASGQNTLSNLSIGSSNEVLTVSGGIPVWTTPGTSYWAQNGVNIYRNTGNVGISTNNPQYKLDVNGTVNATSFRGDGAALTNVALSTDLASNSTRIGTVTTDLTSNSTRIGTVSTDLASNSTRIGTVSTDLASNVVRIGTLESEVQPVNRGGTNITSYGTGDMLYASAPSALSKLTPSTAGFFLQTNGTGNAPTWENVANIGSSTPANLYTDDYITGGPWSGLTDANIRVLGNVSNLSNQLVARDDKGDIFVSNVNAIRIYGDGTFLTGVALSTDLVSNSTRIGTISTDLASNSTRIGTLSTDLASNSTRIGTLSTDLASNSTRIGTISTDLASNSTRIGTISTDLASNSTRITNLQNSTIISNSSGITNAFETGDLIYASGQNTLSNLSIGSTSQVLTVSGGIPVWAAASGGGGGGGGYWTQNVNNDVYYNTGNVGISNTAPTNTLDIGSNVSINDSASDVLSVRSGNTFIEKNLFVGGVITSPVGGSMKIDTMTVRSLNVRNMVVVAERPPKNIILN